MVKQLSNKTPRFRAHNFLSTTSPASKDEILVLASCWGVPNRGNTVLSVFKIILDHPMFYILDAIFKCHCIYIRLEMTEVLNDIYN